MSPCATALLAALNALPGRPANWPEHAQILARSIAVEVHSPREAAIVVTLGRFESNLLPRIQAGDCQCFVVRGQRQCECDWNARKKRFEAHGYWQLHPWVPEWPRLLGLDEETVRLNARVVSRIVRRGLRVCRTVEGAIGYFACGSCRWTGAARRAKFATNVEAKLAACGGKV